MSPSPSSTCLSPVRSAPLSGELFARDLSALVEEIERTRDWFNAQMEAQLASLHQLREAMQPDDSHQITPMAALFEAPPTASVLPPETAPMPAPEPVIPPAKTIVLPATMTAALNPQMEQATLQELNTALSRAFAEISSRGGMLA